MLEVEREKRGPCGSKGHCVASVLADVACSLRQAQEADPKHVNPPEAALPVTETQTAQEWLDNLQLMQPFLDVSVMNPEYLVGGHSTPLPDSDETFSFNPAFAVTT